MTDPTGRKVSYRYDYGLLSEKTVAPASANPATWTYASDATGNLVTSTDPTGRTAYSGYDTAGSLTSTTDTAGNVTTLTYTAAHQVKTVTAADGAVTTYGYDTAGNLMSRSTPTGPAGGSGTATWTWTRDPAQPADVLTATDPAGKTTSYTYDSRGFLTGTTDPTGRTTSVTRSTYGEPLTTTAPGGAVTTYAYHPGGRLHTVTDPEGAVLTVGYDAVGRRTTVTDAAGKTWTQTYDPAGRRTELAGPLGPQATYGYDDAHRLTSTADADGVTVTTTYDAHGRPATETHATGAVTTLTYDAAGRVLTARTEDPAAPGTALTETNGYDTAGRPSQTTGPDGITTTVGYDVLNRVTSSATAGAGTTLTGYNRAGNVAQVTAPDGAVTTHTHDPRGLLTETVAADGGRTTFGYDDAGRPTTTVTPRGNTAGNDPADYTTTGSYDPTGQLDTVTDPLGRTTSYDYDLAGRLVATTDPKGRTATQTWTARGLLASVTATDGATTTFAYDAAQRVVATVTPRGNATGNDPAAHTSTYTYTAAGRTASSTDPLGRTATTTWTNGLLTTSTTGLGTTSYTHDTFGRPTGIDYSDTTPDVAFGYDTAGRLASVTDGDGTKTYAYSPSTGRLTGISRGPDTWTYGHDAYGRLESRTRPDGTAETVTRDAAGRVTGVDYGSAAHPMTYTHDPDRRIVTATAADAGFRETYTYDRAGQVTGVTTDTKDTAGAWVTATEHTVTRDATGNPSAVTVTRDGTSETRSYRYDDADRLTAVCYGTATCTTAAATQTWAYDQDGTRTSETTGGVTTNYTVDAAGQVVATDDGTTVRTWSYDADGNVLSDGRNQYTYWLNGALRSHTHGGASTDYTVDAADRRLTATRGGATTSYAWDETANGAAPADVTDAAGTTRYFTGPTGATYQAAGPAGTTLLGHDVIGSVVDAYTDAAVPARVGATDYAAFGADRTPVGAPAGTIGELGFGGSLRTGNGVYHLRARDYDPVTAQFTAPDPLGDGHGYVGNRPTVFVDPEGLCSRSSVSSWVSWGDEGCLAAAAAGVPGGDPLDNSLTFAVGTGDELTGGASRWVRHQVGLGGAVNECSTSYRTGEYGGMVAGIFMPGPKSLGLLRRLDSIGGAAATRADDVAKIARGGAGAVTRVRGPAAADMARQSRWTELRAQLRTDTGSFRPSARPTRGGAGTGAPSPLQLRNVAAKTGSVAAAEARQVTVLGRYTGGVDGYVGKPGFNTLDLPFKGTGRWNWTRNKRFIDDAIERGDEIRLVTDPTAPLYRGGNTFQRELKYLQNRGYTWQQQGDYWNAVPR